jgi:hypothetical protein
MKFSVSLRLDIEAENADAAAVEADRLLMTTRPREFSVSAPRSGTVFVRVERGEAKRIA